MTKCRRSAAGDGVGCQDSLVRSFLFSPSLWECERTNRPGSESKPVSIMDQIKAANTCQLRVCGCHGHKRSCTSLSYMDVPLYRRSNMVLLMTFIPFIIDLKRVLKLHCIHKPRYTHTRYIQLSEVYAYFSRQAVSKRCTYFGIDTVCGVLYQHNQAYGTSSCVSGDCIKQ